MKYNTGDFLRITDLGRCRKALSLNATHVLKTKVGNHYSYYLYKNGKKVENCYYCLNDEHLEPLDRITSIDQLTHGMRVVAKINGEWIYDAKISYEDGDYYICQNRIKGYSADRKLGYKYSWHIGFLKLDKSEFNGLYAWDKLPEKPTTKGKLLTKYSELQHGMSVTCEIDNKKVDDARLSINSDGRVYVCQNVKEGSDANDNLSYEYGWWLSNEYKNIENWSPYVKNLLSVEEPKKTSKQPTSNWNHHESYSKDGITFDRDTVKLPGEEISIQELRDRLNLYRSIVRKYDSVFYSDNS